MRFAACLIVVALFVGCDNGPPRIDGTSEATFRESVQKVRAGLSPEKDKEFQESVGAAAAEGLRADGIRPGPVDAEKMKARVAKALHGKTADEVIAAGKQTKAAHGIP
jgi:hypothetical protein